MYKLLAINVDGTLLKSNGRITKATKDAVQYVKQKDVYVTLVTSRNFPAAKKIAKALKLDSYLITHGGSYISRELDQPIFEKRITEEETFDIVRFLEDYKCNIRLLHEKFSIANKVRIKSNLMAKAVLRSSDPLFYPLQFVSKLSDYLMDDPISPPKIDLYFSANEERDQVKKMLEAKFNTIDVIIAHDKMLEIVPKQVSKYNGLKILGEKVGIPLHDMVVIGDSYNDKEMIEHAGLGVAMGQAPLEVKRAADWVTRSNDQNGVAYTVIEQFRKQVRLEFLRKVTK